MKNRLLVFPAFLFSFACLAQTGTMAPQQPDFLAESHSVIPPIDSATYPADNSRPWNLQQCISYAQQNNLTVRQQHLNMQLAKIDLRQSQGNVLPNLNGFASHTYNYGRTVDRFTNTFANSRVLSENLYLSSSVTLFSGLQNYNTIKQSQYNLRSGQLQLEQINNDIAMQVAGAYLQVLYADAQAEVAGQQVGMTEEQAARMQKLVDAGSSSQAALLQLQAQLAQEQVALITAENNLTLSYLNLAQLMNLDSAGGFQIQKPSLEMPDAAILGSSPEAIFRIALGNQAFIKKAETDYMSADRGVAVARGALSPTLTLQGSIGTGYSGLAKDITGTTYTGVDTIAATTGGDYVVTPIYSYDYATTPYAEQFDNNFNKSIGVQLSIPIFNRFQVSSNIERAKIQRENAQINIDLSQQQLRKDIQQAWADAKASFEKYQASVRAVDAAQASFSFTEQKFNVGAVNTFDYNNAKNQLAKAQSELLQAKFDYIFRLKILDYYQGKPLTF